MHTQAPYPLIGKTPSSRQPRIGLSGVASIASVRTLASRHRFRRLGYVGHPHPIDEDKRFKDEVLWEEMRWGLIKIFTNNTYVIHVYYNSIAIVMQS